MKNKLFPFLLFLACLHFNSYSQTLYVKANASGTNTGTSWINAFTDLNSAVTLAKSGDTIKIAKGTYIPPGNYYSLKDSVVVLGGYPNTGNPTNAERNWAINQTILSGNGTKLNILILYNGTHSETEINGLIFENGYSHNNNGNPVIPGVCISTRNGSPTITNCVFRNNKNLNSDYGGSSVFCDNSNARISNCFFLDNTDTRYGTIYCTGSGSPSFYNCVISKNAGPNIAYSNQSNIKFINSTFFGNKLNEIIGSDPSTILISSSSNSTIANCIFYENKFGNTSDSIDIKLNSSVIAVQNTITQVYNSGSPSFISVNPKFLDTSNILGPDNLYFTNDDGLQLVNPCSNAINTGNNTAVMGINTDIIGRQRVFNSNVDLGAYEVQTSLLTVPAVLYVKANANGLNNGTSWANAYTNLQSALQNCSDTIKVAAGTYFPSSTNIYTAFWLENHRVVLGGYPNTGNPGNDLRNPITYPTILSGNLPSGNHSPIIVKGRHIDNTSLIDGLIISDGSGEVFTTGALYLLNNASPKISNTTLKNNIGVNRSSAITILNGSSPEFIRCTLENNGSSSSWASNGAVHSDHATPTFKNCIFRMNSTWIGNVSSEIGGAIVNVNSNTIIDSCLFFKNRANNAGGAIANINSSPIITNSSFIGNALESNDGQRMGNDIFNDHSSPTVTNCIFSDSSAADKGGTIAQINNSASLYTNCEFRNSKAIYDGSIFFNDNSSVEFNRCSFQGSSLGSAASTISNFNNSSCKIVNSIAFNNAANSFVGSSDGVIQIVNSTIAHNTLTRVFAHGGSGQLNIVNTILWDNVIVNAAEIVSTGSATISATNSMFQSFGTNGVNGNRVGINPRLIDLTNAIGPDGAIKTNDDGFVLCSCSPAINSGNNNAISTYSTDLLNNVRVFGSTVDIGAYEFQSSGLTIPNAAYVRQNASGNNDGTSWQNAYTNLQKAIATVCADTIKIAGGVYKAAMISRDSSFYINRGVVIYGGYPNTAFPSETDRDPDIYPTIISGELGPSVDSSDNAKLLFLVNSLYDTVIVDGLSFTRAYNIGAIKSINNKNFTIRNSRFFDNYTMGGAAALISQASNIEIDKCIFSQNGTLETGSGTLRIQSISGNAVIKNSIFWNNKANFGGGAYANDSAHFENCLFYANNSFFGAGVYLEGNPAAKITNCTFYRNNHWYNEFKGTDLFDGTEGPSKVIVRNTVFKDQLFHDNPNPLDNADWYRTTSGSGTPPPLNVDYSITRTNVPSAIANSHPNNFTFMNQVNPLGVDNKWFTFDDGLHPDPCTPSINTGNNASVSAIPTDITGSPRILNGTVDRGAYESKGLSVSIATVSTSVCVGTNVTFTAIVINGGASPTYQWKINGVNAGTNSNTFTTSSLANGDQITLQVTSSIACLVSLPVTSNTIIIQVSSGLTSSITISASATSICTGSNVTFTATPVNGGASPVYQWQINGVNAGTNSNTFSSNTLASGAQIKVSMTSSLSCASPAITTSNTITMVVNTIVPPSVSISASATAICVGAGVTFTATPTNGGTNPSYQWQVNGVTSGTNNAVFSTSSLSNGDQVKVIMTSNADCISPTTATSNLITMIVNAIVTPSVSISTPTTTICNGSAITFTATPTNGGASPAYQWQVNGINVGTNSNSFSTTTLNNNDQVKVIMTSNQSCVSTATATSNTIVITMTSTVTPTVSINTTATTICAGSSTTFTATPINGGANPSYQWQVNGVNAGTNSNIFTTSSLPNGAQVKVIMTSSLSCASPVTATSNVITMSVNPSVIPSVSLSASATSLCTGASTTFTATPTNGGTNPSYQWQVNGINAGTNSNSFTTSSLTNGAQVKVIMTSNAGCASPLSATSNVITITVNSPSIPFISISGTTTVQTGQNTMLSSAIQNGGGNPQYQWQDSTTLHNWQNIIGGTSSALSYAPVTTGDKVRCRLISNAGCANPTTVTSTVLLFTVEVINGIIYYPNPANSVISVSNLKLSDQWQTLDVVALDGRRPLLTLDIINQTKKEINIEKLASGQYIIILRRMNGTSVFIKFIKI